jgi:hypothetical protein
VSPEAQHQHHPQASARCAPSLRKVGVLEVPALLVQKYYAFLYIYLVQLTHTELSRGELDDQIRRFDGASVKKGMGGPLGTGIPSTREGNTGSVRLVHECDTRDRLHPRQPQVRLAPSAPQVVVERDSEGVALSQVAFAKNTMQTTRLAPGRSPPRA